MIGEDEVILFYYYYRRRKRVQRRFWVHPYIEINMDRRLFICARELSEDDAKFKACYRMCKSSFTNLVAEVGPKLTKLNTRFRESVCAEEKILITLR